MGKRQWHRREGKRFVLETGIICSAVALVCIFLSFVSPYWIISWPRVFSEFKQIGLWEVCLAGLVLEMDPSQKAYHGCWWILAPEFKNIRKWLMPSWFVWTQVAVTFCFVCAMIGFGLMMFIWMRTGWTQRDPKVRKRRDPLILLHISLIMMISITIVMATTVIMFGIQFKMDRNWLPNPKFNYLSWSYGLAILSTFFCIFSSIAQFVYVSIVRQETREPPTSEPVMVHDQTSLWAGSSGYLNKSNTSVNKSKENLNRSKENLDCSKESLNCSKEILPLLAPGGSDA